jgi:hypothetical protein
MARKKKNRSRKTNPSTFNVTPVVALNVKELSVEEVRQLKYADIKTISSAEMVGWDIDGIGYYKPNLLHTILVNEHLERERLFAEKHGLCREEWQLRWRKAADSINSYSYNSKAGLKFQIEMMEQADQFLSKGLGCIRTWGELYCKGVLGKVVTFIHSGRTVEKEYHL